MRKITVSAFCSHLLFEKTKSNLFTTMNITVSKVEALFDESFDNHRLYSFWWPARDQSSWK